MECYIMNPHTNLFLCKESLLKNQLNWVDDRKKTVFLLNEFIKFCDKNMLSILDGDFKIIIRTKKS